MEQALDLCVLQLDVLSLAAPLRKPALLTSGQQEQLGNSHGRQSGQETSTVHGQKIQAA
jgi:hypothetical protein